MHLNLLTPKRTINKAYLKEKVSRTDIELFKTNFADLLQKINDKGDEEHLKSLIADFLKFTWYKDVYQINPIGKNDLVIHTGKSPSDPIGVLLEVKSPSNTAEMISEQKPNAKSIHELILYYLNERIVNNRHDIKQLIATNVYNWYLFDANEFDKKIYRNTAIKKLFEQKRADGKDNPWFYDELKKLLNDKDLSLDVTFFDLRDYKKTALNTDNADDNKLIPLFKIVSPVHLLKLSFANDSNTLQPKFYSELLHIIGLYEYKEGSKKLISRKKEGERNGGSLLENAIVNLDSHDKISRLDKPSQYGENYQERLYNVALELVITWVNRILFLKLLEAQLLNYHKGDKSYTFLNKVKIRDFDDLDKLFFRVLAKKVDERSNDIMKLFGKVPYLNSSLFEPTELEHQTLFINGLEDFVALPLLSSTVLKDERGKTRKGTLNTLDYLFDFLNAYDFSSEGAEEIQEDNKTLINASVLGLIFEKINGYKDGSFFTPGFITMYMCRETIRRAVVQKFNEAKGWDVKEYAELYDLIKDRKEANTIINSLKICDPAVGSGHFLVSALNEIIAIKSDLNILMSADGRTLRDYHIEVVNDELIVTDENGDPFTYRYQDLRSQTVQQTLFHEKQTIIENCLFGVDINPNSVKICRLRLWIELLKNAYYKPAAGDGLQLETLPNIDINIKTGNSLISRFALDADLKPALKKNNISIDAYRNAVSTYRNARDKEQKREMEGIINAVKSNIRTEIAKNDPKLLKLSKLNGDIYNLENQQQLFGESRAEAKARKSKLEKLQKEVETLSIEVEEIKSNKIYENAFEWRFEFPEVLSDDGVFLGFDVVIGNPPYGLFNKKQNQNISLTTDERIVESLKSSFPEAMGGVINAARVFYAFGFYLLSNSGFQAMIVPYGILTEVSSLSLRKHIFEKYSIIKIDAFPERDNVSKRVFEDVKMSTAIIISTKSKSDTPFDVGISYQRKTANFDRLFLTVEDIKSLNIELMQIPLTNTEKFKLLLKIFKSDNTLKIKEFSQCLTGEIDITFGKSALTVNIDDRMFIKGVQIDRYVLKTKDSQISQGIIEYLNIDKFKEGYSGKKLFDAFKKRIALQGLTGVNEKRRLKATIVKGECYLANSSNYLLENNLVSLEYLLAILNSNLMNFIFKIKSTSSNVNGYEVDDLPIRINSQFTDSIEMLVQKITDQKEKNYTSDTTFFEQQIDELVYKIYNLTEDEIKIVEGEA